MTLDAQDRQWIETTFRQIVAGAPVDVAILPRLSVEQFACAVELSAYTIHAHIRCRQIPAEFVFGGRPKKIGPRVLELYGVTPQEAKSRLTTHNLLPADVLSSV